MREILFRGKTEQGNWFVGSLHKYTIEKPSKTEKHYKIQEFNYGYNDENGFDCDYMSGFDEEVIPETVGQFTGLTDKNGKKIFEGDIVKVDRDGDILEIMYCERGYFCANNNAWWEFIDELGKFEIIGNIHDNPELLEVAE